LIALKKKQKKKKKKETPTDGYGSLGGVLGTRVPGGSPEKAGRGLNRGGRKGNKLVHPDPHILVEVEREKRRVNFFTQHSRQPTYEGRFLRSYGRGNKERKDNEWGHWRQGVAGKVSHLQAYEGEGGNGCSSEQKKREGGGVGKSSRETSLEQSSDYVR